MTRWSLFPKTMFGRAALLMAIWASFSFVSPAPGAENTEWPPRLERSEEFNGRQTDWFGHGSLPEWGAKDSNQTDSFAVVHPKSPEERDAPNRPLYVVLHSAGHDLVSCLGCTETIGNHDIYRSPDDFYALYVDCRKNQATDWWWGGLRDDETMDNGNRDKAGPELSPVEKRVMATVREVIGRYKVDPNRVYLCGNSMGGSGTLGLGLRHGDVFAAIKANVPAGARHAADRLLFSATEAPDGFSLPDPPVCVDYSGSNDRWSRDHAILFRGMKSRRYPLLAFWGPFGHENNHAKIEKVNDLVNRFDWLAIRKDRPYPVFTDASSDTDIPWPAADRDFPDDAPAGQVNGFFRWENRSESIEKMEMTLRLASTEETGSVLFPTPAESVADVSFRRLGVLRPKPGEKFGWTFGSRRGTVVAEKDQFASEGSDGLITIRRLPITVEPTLLTLQKNPDWPGESVKATDLGFRPDGTPEENAAALQRALDGGNKTVFVDSGVYPLDRTVYLDSGTRLVFAEGAVLKKAANYSHVLLNRGALTGQWNENIEIEGLEISTGGVSVLPEEGSPLFGLRGQLAFYRVKNLEVRNFRCLDVVAVQYAIQICRFENILLERFEIRGKKDGIHIGAGRGFVVRDGVCETFDDALALNAQDYATGQPQQGDIRDGWVERLTDLRMEPTSGHAIRLLTGAWSDWRPGIRLQNGDTVSHNGAVYRVVATFDTTEYVSKNPPTHEKGAWTDPEVPELKFVFNVKDDSHASNIRNVTFHDVTSNSRVGFGTYWESNQYHRAVHPDVSDENLPVCEVKIENFRSVTPNHSPIMTGNSNVTVLLENVAGDGPLFQFNGGERSIKADLTIQNSPFLPNDKPENVFDVQLGGKASGRVFLRENRLERDIRLETAEGIDVVGKTKR